jgi:N-acetylglucosamine repressor
MRHPSGHSVSAVRNQNHSAVLRLVQQQEHPISRREIAQRTGLDPSTITHIVSEFIANGLVSECGTTETEGRTRRGRREIGLEFVPSAAYAIGIHLGVRSIRAAQCDLRGRIRARRAALLDPGTTPAAAIQTIGDLVADLRGTSDDRHVVGVGIGAIAFVDPRAGVIRSAPSLGWGEVAISGPLSERLSLPVLLDHHVRAMALAERWFGHARGIPNFALINVDSSVGVGTVINGELLHGDNSRAGQIAHMVVDEAGPWCTCGRRGCLVMLASYRAIARRAGELVQRNPDSPLAHSLAERPGVPAEYVAFDLARQGDPLARSLIAEAAGYVSVAAAHLISFLDPQLIILAAAAKDHAEILLEPVRETVLAHAPLDPLHLPCITTSALGRDLAVLGAAALTVEHFVAGPRWPPTDSKNSLAKMTES